MSNALIGLLGVLLGVLLGEYFRRSNRIEVYSQKIFDKRLTVHEELFAKFVEGGRIISEVMTNKNLNEDERHDLVSSIIVPLCEFMDANSFYIDKYLAAQVAASYMGAEDVLNSESETDINLARLEVLKSAKLTKNMILEEAGVVEVFKHFSTISKSKPNSNIISRIKELEDRS